MVSIFIATCLVLVAVVSAGVAFYVFTKRRESNERVEALASQRSLDEAVMNDMLANSAKHVPTSDVTVNRNVPAPPAPPVDDGTGN